MSKAVRHFLDINELPPKELQNMLALSVAMKAKLKAHETVKKPLVANPKRPICRRSLLVRKLRMQIQPAVAIPQRRQKNHSGEIVRQTLKNPIADIAGQAFDAGNVRQVGFERVRRQEFGR